MENEFYEPSKLYLRDQYLNKNIGHIFCRDIYEYDEESNIAIGKNSHKIYRVGSFVHVKCIAASKALSQIDFEQVNPQQEKDRSR